MAESKFAGAARLSPYQEFLNDRIADTAAGMNAANRGKGMDTSKAFDHGNNACAASTCAIVNMATGSALKIEDAPGLSDARVNGHAIPTGHLDFTGKGVTDVVGTHRGDLSFHLDTGAPFKENLHETRHHSGIVGTASGGDVPLVYSNSSGRTHYANTTNRVENGLPQTGVDFVRIPATAMSVDWALHHPPALGSDVTLEGDFSVSSTGVKHEIPLTHRLGDYLKPKDGWSLPNLPSGPNGHPLPSPENVMKSLTLREGMYQAEQGHIMKVEFQAGKTPTRDEALQNETYKRAVLTHLPPAQQDHYRDVMKLDGPTANDITSKVGKLSPHELKGAETNIQLAIVEAKQGRSTVPDFKAGAGLTEAQATTLNGVLHSERQRSWNAPAVPQPEKEHLGPAVDGIRRQGAADQPLSPSPHDPPMETRSTHIEPPSHVKQAMSQNALPGIRYGAELTAAANKYHLDPLTLGAIAAQESGGPGSIQGRNVVEKGGGGVGVMQIDSGAHSFAKTKEAMEPAKNIEYAAKYYKELLDNRGGNERAALHDYNHGPNAAPSHESHYEDSVEHHKADLKAHLQKTHPELYPQSGHTVAPQAAHAVAPQPAKGVAPQAPADHTNAVPVPTTKNGPTIVGEMRDGKLVETPAELKLKNSIVDKAIEDARHGIADTRRFVGNGLESAGEIARQNASLEKAIANNLKSEPAATAAPPAQGDSKPELIAGSPTVPSALDALKVGESASINNGSKGVEVQLQQQRPTANMGLG